MQQQARYKAEVQRVSQHSCVMARRQTPLRAITCGPAGVIVPSPSLETHLSQEVELLGSISRSCSVSSHLKDTCNSHGTKKAPSCWASFRGLPGVRARSSVSIRDSTGRKSENRQTGRAESMSRLSSLSQDFSIFRLNMTVSLESFELAR